MLLTQEFINTIQNNNMEGNFSDDKFTGLYIKKQKDTEACWCLCCGNWNTIIGTVKDLTINTAREKALIALSELNHRSINLLIHNVHRLNITDTTFNWDTDPLKVPHNYVNTLGELISAHADTKTNSKYIPTILLRYFDPNMNLNAITLFWAEEWRKKFIAAGHKTATGNRAVSALRTLLNWGEKRNLCKATLKNIKMEAETDSNVIIRYLDKSEEERLRSALKDFDLVFQTFIITELNTGIRLTALLSLQWNDLDFNHQQITLRASTAKNKTNKTVPMNSEAKKALLTLKNSPTRCVDCDNFVFVNPKTKTRYKNITKLWKKLKDKAQIEDLRFHDLRHNFASQLVMDGVELNTVRELMTHSDIKMTLRYAHLAPDKKLKDVEKLVKHK